MTLVRKKFTRIAEKPALEKEEEPASDSDAFKTTKDALNNPKDTLTNTKDALTYSNEAFADLENALTKTKDLLGSTANESAKPANTLETLVSKSEIEANENRSKDDPESSLSATLDQSSGLKGSGFSELHAQGDSPGVGRSGESTTASPGDSAGADSDLIELLDEEEEVEKSQSEGTGPTSHQEQPPEDEPLDEQDQKYYNNFLHNMYMEDHDLLVRFEAMTPADHAVRSQQVEALEALLTAKHHVDLVAAAATHPGQGWRGLNANLHI